MSLRRITILLDRSSSMAGAPIGQAGAFIEWSLVSTLKDNRHLYGNVEVGLIGFDTEAEWLVRPTTIDEFSFPTAFEIGPFGGSCLGSALGFLSSDDTLGADSESDLLVLISDGHFIDDVCEATDRFDQDSRALRISLGVDASFRHPLAYFERWPKGGRRTAGDVFNVTPQDVEGWLAKI